jgi:hypothetical protein
MLALAEIGDHRNVTHLHHGDTIMSQNIKDSIGDAVMCAAASILSVGLLAIALRIISLP